MNLYQNAYKILLSGNSLDAKEAKRIGLVSDVFNHDELINETIKFAKKINNNSQHFLSMDIKYKTFL